MNAQRRKEIQSVLDELMDLRSRVDSLKDDEQEAFDNMPESLQSSESGQKIESAASSLDDALAAFDDLESALNEAAV